MIITNFLVRDFSQCTSQLYLNSFKNRAKYFIYQLISILIASVIVFLTLYVFVLIMQNIGDGKPIKKEMVRRALKYISFNFLVDNVWLGSLKLNR